MTNHFLVDRRTVDRFFRILTWVPFVLIAAYLADMAIGSPAWLLKRLVDLDGESSIPAWFSSMLLFLVALSLLLRGLQTGSDQGPSRWFFVLGCAGFLFLSADEALFIHESIAESPVLRKYPQLVKPLRFKHGYGAWIPMYATILVVLAAIAAPQFLRFWRAHRAALLTFAVGAATFLLGAVALEIVGYQFKELFVAVPAIHTSEIIAEELLEMLGSIIMLRGGASLVLESSEHRADTASPQARARSFG